MQKRMNIVKLVLLGVLMLFLDNMAFAQDQPGSVTMTPIFDSTDKVANKETTSAIPKTPEPVSISVYAEIYGINPDSVYDEYLKALIDAKQYKDAEILVQAQMLHN